MVVLVICGVNGWVRGSGGLVVFKSTLWLCDREHYSSSKHFAGTRRTIDMIRPDLRHGFRMPLTHCYNRHPVSSSPLAHRWYTMGAVLVYHCHTSTYPDTSLVLLFSLLSPLSSLLSPLSSHLFVRWLHLCWPAFKTTTTLKN